MKLICAILALVGINLASCAQHETFDEMATAMAGDKVPTVRVGEFAADSVLFLDTRQRKEFDISHIEGAQFQDYDSFKAKKLKDVDKDQPIVVYCSVGYRSGKVGEKLLKAGYTKVYNLYGGIFEWTNQGNTVVNDAGPTNDVHGYNEKWSKWITKCNKVVD